MNEEIRDLKGDLAVFLTYGIWTYAIVAIVGYELLAKHIPAVVPVFAIAAALLIVGQAFLTVLRLKEYRDTLLFIKSMEDPEERAVFLSDFGQKAREELEDPMRFQIFKSALLRASPPFEIGDGFRVFGLLWAAKEPLGLATFYGGVLYLATAARSSPSF